MDPNASLAQSSSYKDYYRNLSPHDFIGRLDLDLHFETWFFHENIFHKDLYFVGLKCGPTSNEKLHRIDALRAAVSNIRRERPLSRSDVAASYAKHYFKCFLVRLLGEMKFHDFKYALRQLARRCALAIFGQERVRRYRERRRSKVE